MGPLDAQAGVVTGVAIEQVRRSGVAAAGPAAAMVDEAGVDQASHGGGSGVLADTQLSGERAHVAVGDECPVLEAGSQGEHLESRPGKMPERAARGSRRCENDQATAVAVDRGHALERRPRTAQLLLSTGRR
ncbi:MAG TPA: hypothetical protein VG034_26120 [Acidimicrobiia bacterium]|jgi:hypothetical protein|nr:hypothetical protein [Acidimicrobiia bacterium]